MQAITSTEQAKLYFIKHIKLVSDFNSTNDVLLMSLSAPLEKIHNEADFLRALSFMHARSLSKESDLHEYNANLTTLIRQYHDDVHPQTLRCEDIQELIYHMRVYLVATVTNIRRLVNMTPTTTSDTSRKKRSVFSTIYSAAKLKVDKPKTKDKFNMIIPGLYLGIRPTYKLCGKILDRFQHDRHFGPNIIVSAQQDGELWGKVGLTTRDKMPFYFHNQDFNHIQIPMVDNSVELQIRNKATNTVDYSPTDFTTFFKVIDEMRVCIQLGGAAYVNCNNGHGRSSFIVTLYACLYYAPWQKFNGDTFDIDATIDHVYHQLKVAHPQVGHIDPYRRSALTSMITEYLRRKPTVVDAPQNAASTRSGFSTAATSKTEPAATSTSNTTSTPAALAASTISAMMTPANSSSEDFDDMESDDEVKSWDFSSNPNGQN